MQCGKIPNMGLQHPLSNRCRNWLHDRSLKTVSFTDSGFVVVVVVGTHMAVSL